MYVHTDTVTLYVSVRSLVEGKLGSCCGYFDKIWHIRWFSNSQLAMKCWVLIRRIKINVNDAMGINLPTIRISRAMYYPFCQKSVILFALNALKFSN